MRAFDGDIGDRGFIAQFHATLSRNNCLTNISNLFDDFLSQIITAADVALQDHVIEHFE